MDLSDSERLQPIISRGKGRYGLVPDDHSPVRGSGHATQTEIARAFGVAKISIKRAVKLYREQGPKGFYAARKRRGPTVLAASVPDEAQRWLDEGLQTTEVTDRLGIKRDTLSKAVRNGFVLS